MKLRVSLIAGIRFIIRVMVITITKLIKVIITAIIIMTTAEMQIIVGLIED